MAQKFYDEVQLHDYVHISDMEVSGKEIHSVISEDLDALKENYQPVRVKDLAELTSGYDTSKGSIEQRLTALGFKQGSFRYVQLGVGIILNPEITQNVLYRLGNFVIGKFTCKFSVYKFVLGGGTTETADSIILVIDTPFLSSRTESTINGSKPLKFGGAILRADNQTLSGSAYVTVTESENNTDFVNIDLNIFNVPAAVTTYYQLEVVIGYEAEPIDPTTL